MAARRGRPWLTDAEGNEAWAAYQRGVSIYKVAQAFSVGPTMITDTWKRLGWKPNRRRRTNPRAQWLRRLDELQAESGLGHGEVLWAALKHATVEGLKAAVDAGIASGEITPTVADRRSWRSWSRAGYKHRMFGTKEAKVIDGNGRFGGDRK